MSAMHTIVLNSDQNMLLGLLQGFSDSYYLAGGTAIALQAGHRRSIDFDLFSPDEIDANRLTNSIIRQGRRIEHVFTISADELTLAVDSVRISFVFFPFAIQHDIWFKEIISMPDLLTLAAMKAYALGRRAKWKDYVDMYVLFKNHVHFNDVVARAGDIFQGAFNQRLFREQLCYFHDIDYSEDIEFLTDSPPEKEQIQAFLTRTAGIKIS